MRDVQFDGHMVLVPIPKALLVLTRQQFVEALQRGKAYRRHQARQRREAHGQGKAQASDDTRNA